MLALLVQASFVAMVLLSSQRPLPLRTLAHETILILHPTPPPSTIDARAPSVLSTAPPIVRPPPSSPPVMIAPLAPPGGIAGFGRSLFGCAPEHYADLTPDELARCPKPGEGMAKRDDNDLATRPRSHAKDELLWQEQWAEDHYVPAVCPLGDGPGAVAHCVLEQAKAENHRRADAWQKIEEQKAARLQEPKRPVPNIGVRRN